MTPPSETPAAVVPAPLQPGSGFDLSALSALFWLTLRQNARGRKLLVLAALYLLFCGLALLIRSLGQDAPGELVFGLVFNLVPHALAPLTALLYATGMIQDEVEEQTLTYLLVRPIPRWALYLTKWFATVLTTSFVTVFFTLLLMLAAQLGEVGVDLLPRALRLAGVLAVTQIAYCSVFGLLSLLFRRALFVGVIYVVVFEGIIASIDFVVRRITIMYYFRVLCLRSFHLSAGEKRNWESTWSIDLADAPTLAGCLQTLLLFSLVVLIFAAARFARQEFRMKTPESS